MSKKPKKEKSIKRKVTLTILINSMVSIAAVAVVGLSGMAILRDTSIEGSKALGNTAGENSREAIVQQVQSQLVSLVDSNSKLVNRNLAAISGQVEMTADLATKIYTNKDSYSKRDVDYAPTGSDGTFTVHLKTAEGVTKESVQSEIDYAANITDFLSQINTVDYGVNACYIGSESGFQISADKDTKTSTQKTFDVTNRGWYKLAKQADGDTVWTGVFEDSAGRGASITCAKAFYDNSDGQTKLAGVAACGATLDNIYEIVENAAIGDNGYSFILNAGGNIVISPNETDIEVAENGEVLGENYLTSENGEKKALAQKMISGENGISEMTLNNEKVYVAYAPLKQTGWSMASVVRISDVIAPAAEMQEQITAMADQTAEDTYSQMRTASTFIVGIILVVVGIIILSSMKFSKRLTDPIHKLSAEVENIDGGQLGEKIEISTGDEIEHLANSFNSMTMKLSDYMENLKKITAEKERIGAELDVATHIQASMLPCIFPAFPDRSELDVYGSMTPAKEVGGDFYDFFLVDDNHLALVIADVSGKGVPAALFMVIAKTLIKNNALAGLSPKQVLEKVNNQLCENNEAEMFVTVWLGIMEISSGKMTCVNAGHEYPAIKRKNGEFELFKDKHGFVVAGMEGVRYKEYELEFNPGDRLFVYTDGVTEATNDSDELLGNDRLIEALNRHKDDSTIDLLRNMKGEIDSFVGDAPQFDDITMVTFEISQNVNSSEKLMLDPDITAVSKATEFAEAFYEKYEIPMKVQAQLNIAIDEILTNVVSYSNAVKASITCSVEGDYAVIRFADNGIAYNPTERSDPDTTLSAEERDIGGLGIFMVKKSMDSMEYSYNDMLNVLVIKKKFK